jgi:hypothetical protein
MKEWEDFEIGLNMKSNNKVFNKNTKTNPNSFFHNNSLTN